MTQISQYFFFLGYLIVTYYYFFQDPEGTLREQFQSFASFGKDRHKVELVSKELNHLAAILHVYAGGLNFMK